MEVKNLNLIELILIKIFPNILMIIQLGKNSLENTILFL
jgi:hypothetical protein